MNHRRSAYRQEEPATIVNATVAVGFAPATTTLAAPVKNSVEYNRKKTTGCSISSRAWVELTYI